MNRNLEKFIYCFILFPVLVFGTAFPEYQIETISVEGEIRQIRCEYLNADGAPDLLVLHTSSHFPETKIHRFISIFFQNTGDIPETADRILAADNGESVYDIADLDRDGKPELLFLKEDGCYAMPFGDSLTSDKEHPLLRTQSLFLSFDKAQFIQFPLSFDLDGDSMPEILIPQMHRIDVYAKNDTGYGIVNRLWLDQPFRFSDRSPLSLTVWPPDLAFQDFNGDGRPDLLYTQSQKLDIFLNHFEKSAENLTPPDLRYSMLSRHLTQSALDQLAPSATSLEIHDLNGDGCSDLLLIQSPRAQFPSRISQIQIYMNHYGKLRTLPDQIITAENFGGEHIVRDFNGDGLLDIATLNFDIGIFQAAKFLLTKKVKNIYQIYRMRPDYTYPENPDFRIGFHRRLTLADLAGTGLHGQSFEGDFNGDGLSDFIVAAEKNRFDIYSGTGSGQFSKKPAWKIPTATSEQFLIKDINQDGYSDLVLWFPDSPDRAGRITLIKSRPGISP